MDHKDKGEGVILMAALNGSRLRKTDYPQLPVTSEEIAKEAKLCRDAGAAMVHVHVRDSNDQHALDADLFREVMEEIKTSVGEDIIFQVTTEAVGRYAPEEQMELVEHLRPEAVSVALSELLPEGGDETRVSEFLKWLHKEGVWPQFILYRPEDLTHLLSLQQKGVVPFKHLFVLFVLGRYQKDMQSNPEDLDPFLDELGANDISWMMCAFGRAENACAGYAIAKGGHARIGFENNILLPDGSQASSNADLIQLVAKEAEAIPRPVMSAADVRLLKSHSFLK